MPNEEKEEERQQPNGQQPKTEPDEFTKLTKMFQEQMGISDRQQAGAMLGNILKDAGVGQDQAQGVLSKMADTLNQIPSDMPMARASADHKLSQEIQGQQGLQAETMQVLKPMMPYLMAFKILDKFGGNQNNRSDIEDLLLKKTVKEKFGEGTAKSDDKLDEIASELRTLKRRMSSGDVDRGTAIDTLSKKAEKLNSQMEKFGEVAKSMGYKREDEGTLEKVQDVTGQFKDIMGNLRESAPSKSGPKPKPNGFQEANASKKTEVPIEEETPKPESESEPEPEPESESALGEE